MSEDISVLQYKIAEQSREIAALQTGLATMQEAMAARDIARMAEERRMLRAGLKGFGSIILLLGAVIWTYRAVIIGDMPKPPHN